MLAKTVTFIIVNPSFKIHPFTNMISSLQIILGHVNTLAIIANVQVFYDINA